MAAKGNGAFLGGVVLGGAIGAIASLWLDPRTTRQVRRTMRNAAERLPELATQVGETTITLSEQVCHRAAVLAEDLHDDWQGTSERLRDAAIAGLHASRQEYYKVMADRDPEPNIDRQPDKQQSS